MAPSPGQDVCVRVFLDRWNMQEIRLFLTALVIESRKATLGCIYYSNFY